MQTAQVKKEYRQVSLPYKKTVKMEGNVAYISTATPAKHKPAKKAAQPKKNAIMAAAAEKALREAAEKKQAKRVKTGAITTIFVVFIAFCALAFLISRYSVACGVNSENNKLQSNIDKVNEQISELKTKMELSDSLEHIENVAVNEFGMNYPEQSQKVHLDIN